MNLHTTVIQLKKDLDLKWQLHGDTCQSVWATLNKKQREKCMRAGSMEGAVLKSPRDDSLGNVNKFLPEWNLEDVTKPSSNHLIKLIEHRATRSLTQQYAEGVDGGLGDYHFILDMVVSRRLHCADNERMKDCWTLFIEGPEYGTSYRIVDERAKSGFGPAIKASVCIPQEVGELILYRQMYLLQVMNIIIEDILEINSVDEPIPEAAKAKNKKSGKASGDQSTQSLAIRPAPAVKRTLQDLIPLVQDQADGVQEFLTLLTTSAPLLANEVNHRFFSQPGLIPDEKGRRLCMHTDNYISPIFLETVHQAVQGASLWNYLSQLMQLLEKHSSDKIYKPIILQEISNVCHLEFSRAQDTFKRNFQCHMGAKHFKRVSTSADSLGNHKVNIKGKPSALISSDAQLCYMLRLCQPQTTASSAVQLVSALEVLHRDDQEWERLSETEARSLGDLAAIVGLIQDISPTISMPPLSRKKGQMFVARSKSLDTEINSIKDQIDLSRFVIPIDNISKAEVAEGALQALDEFVNEKAGSNFGFLYQDLIEECLADLQRQYEAVQARVKLASNTASSEWVPLPVPPQDEPAVRFEKRREKQKTRPKHSSIFNTVPSSPPSLSSPTIKRDAKLDACKRISVSREALEVFGNLFRKSNARGSVDWVQFEKAMTAVGFRVTPKFGSVIQFSPPPPSTGYVPVQKSITFHRPHQSKIEGYRILYHARRLNSVYGWDEDTFLSSA
ncbi:ipa protein [Ceratocystis lukuohia]|uniref:Ipa protein n=1 Tax=Ceratocystis lukuohia TaxID=2019550 RepID=A0ABR4MMN5_9PEZI